jgi:hypothetical protein
MNLNLLIMLLLIKKIAVTGTIKIHIGHLKPITKVFGELMFGVV